MLFALVPGFCWTKTRSFFVILRDVAKGENGANFQANRPFNGKSQRFRECFLSKIRILFYRAITIDRKHAVWFESTRGEGEFGRG